MIAPGWFVRKGWIHPSLQSRPIIFVNQFSIYLLFLLGFWGYSNRFFGGFLQGQCHDNCALAPPNGSVIGWGSVWREDSKWNNQRGAKLTSRIQPLKILKQPASWCCPFILRPKANQSSDCHEPEGSAWTISVLGESMGDHGRSVEVVGQWQLKWWAEQLRIFITQSTS